MPEPQPARRTLAEITRLIEVYPPRWRRWCDGPERDGCACMGCVRVPAPSTVRGDPEGKPFLNPADRLTEAEVAAYLAVNPREPDPLADCLVIIGPGQEVRIARVGDRGQADG